MPNNTTVFTNSQYYQNIAAAIRSKNGQSTLYKPSEMGPAINALVVSGESVRLQTKTVDPTTVQQNIIADAGYHGLSAVTIGAIQTETKTIIENGTYTPTANHFFSNIVVNVAGSDLPDGDLLAYGSAPKQTIWEGTFTGEYVEQIQAYHYETNDLQNCELLKNISEVVVTLDGIAYTLPIESLPSGSYGFMFGASGPSFSDYPFMFAAGNNKSFDMIEIVRIATQTAGPHTLKVEYTPSPEPAMQTIWEGTFNTTYSGEGNVYDTQDVQNGELIKNCNEVTVTFDGVTYVLPVEQGQGPFAYIVGASDAQFSEAPFAVAIGYQSSSSTVIDLVVILTQTEGSHTIKIEGTPSEPSELIVLFNGRPSSGESTNVGNFIQFELPAEDLAELLRYDYVTLSQEGQGVAKLSIHLGTVGGNQFAYAGGDAYPPTSLIDPPNMMVYYTEDDGSNTETTTPRAYVLFERPSGLWQIPNIVIAVDPNDEVPIVPGGGGTIVDLGDDTIK